MGWTGTNKLRGQTMRKFFEREFCGENAKSKWSIVDLACYNRGTENYIAMERIDKETNERCVFGLVVIARWSRERYYNFTYKDMDETMLPYYFNCPVRILDKLSPVPESFGEESKKHAYEWRERCRHRAKQKPQVGDTLVMEHEIQFVSGKAMSKFLVRSIKPLRLADPQFPDSPMNYRIGDLKRYNYIIERKEVNI